MRSGDSGFVNCVDPKHLKSFTGLLLLAEELGALGILSIV